MQNLFKKIYGFTFSCKATDATYIDLNIRNITSLFEVSLCKKQFQVCNQRWYFLYVVTYCTCNEVASQCENPTA